MVKKTDIKIRKAKLGDLPEILQLFSETIKNTCKNDYTPEQIAVWVSSVENEERWIGLLESQYFLVAEIDSIIAGFGSLENGNYLDFMYVSKDFLRHGVAHTIFNHLEKEAKRLGHFEMSDVSITAHPFFEKMGFQLVNTNRNIRKGIEIINYKMTRKAKN